MKQCLLDEQKRCDDCGECDRCDLDPNKLCDNCCKCLDNTEEEYAEIEVRDVVLDNTEAYLSELYRDEDDEDNEEAIPFEAPDPALVRLWEQKLSELEAQERQQLPQIHGARKKKAES